MCLSSKSEKRKQASPHLCCPRAPRTEFHKSNEAVRLKPEHRVDVTCGEQLGLACRSRAIPNAGDYPCDNHDIYRLSIVDLTPKITKEEGLRNKQLTRGSWRSPETVALSFMHDKQQKPNPTSQEGECLSRARFHINTSFHFDNSHHHSVLRQKQPLLLATL